MVRGMLRIPQGENDRRVSAVPVARKSEESLTCRGLVKHFSKRPGDLKRCELHRPHGKSRHRLRVSQIDATMLHRIIV